MRKRRCRASSKKIYLGNPHAHVRAAQTRKACWEVDLAPPGPTERAGFIKGVADVGDTAIVTGHRSKDAKELMFKAETITVNGKTYDVYPNRPKTLKPGFPERGAACRRCGRPGLTTVLLADAD